MHLGWLETKQVKSWMDGSLSQNQTQLTTSPDPVKLLYFFWKQDGFVSWFEVWYCWNKVKRPESLHLWRQTSVSTLNLQLLFPLSFDFPLFRNLWIRLKMTQMWCTVPQVLRKHVEYWWKKTNWHLIQLEKNNECCSDALVEKLRGHIILGAEVKPKTVLSYSGL